jgi:putative FmdB family regulatory protein
MPMYTLYCHRCDTYTEEIIKVDDRDVPLDCNRCAGGVRKRTIDKPASVWAPTSTGGGHK